MKTSPKPISTINFCEKVWSRVTHSRQADMDREAQRDMAQQMDHSISTADTHYNVGKKYDVTSRFRRALSQVLKIQQNKELDVDDVAD